MADTCIVSPLMPSRDTARLRRPTRGAWLAGAAVCCVLAAPSSSRAYDAIQNPPREWIAQGTAYADTFPADLATLRYNATAILLNDGWRFPTATDGDTLVTAWKPLNKFFIKVLFGNVQAQCRVTFHALDARRTRVTFTADAATPRQGAMAALRANADRAYGKAARDWAAHMRRVLAGTDLPPTQAWVAAREIVPPGTSPTRNSTQ